MAVDETEKIANSIPLDVLLSIDGVTEEGNKLPLKKMVLKDKIIRFKI